MTSIFHGQEKSNRDLLKERWGGKGIMHKLVFDIYILLCKLNKESLTEYPECGILLLGRYAHKLNTDRMTDSGETGFAVTAPKGNA